ncbi:MAG: hypothetical protein ACRER2_16090 [Methylococcales bacterium]
MTSPANRPGESDVLRIVVNPQFTDLVGNFKPGGIYGQCRLYVDIANNGWQFGVILKDSPNQPIATAGMFPAADVKPQRARRISRKFVQQGPEQHQRKDQNMAMVWRSHGDQSRE